MINVSISNIFGANSTTFRRLLVTLLAACSFALPGCSTAPPADNGNGNGNANDNGTNGDNFVGGIVLEQLPAALLSASGTSADDVYAVGADTEDGRGPLVLHYDGSTVSRIETGLDSGDLLWISTPPIEGQFLLSGDPGIVLRLDPETNEVQSYETPGDEMMFGIWGVALNDIWVVGGEVFGDNVHGVIWHYDGTAWTVVDVTEFGIDPPPPLFKVWGPSADDVYVVGQAGTILHFDGTTWTQVEAGTERTLFTIHGNDSLIVATGGALSGVIVEEEGDRFVDHASEDNLQMNGVFVTSAGQAYTAGIAGSMTMRNDAGAWINLDTGIDTILDFHAVWVDDENGVWAVGGDLGVALDEGIVAYFGPRTIPNEVTP